jgi:hypothetical protein
MTLNDINMSTLVSLDPAVAKALIDASEKAQMWEALGVVVAAAAMAMVFITLIKEST